MREIQRRIIEAARSSIADNALIIDTETTGLNGDDVIIEIAIIDAAETFEFSALVKPSKPIPAGATKIHGITDEIAGRAMLPVKAWSIVQPIIIGRRLLAFNAEYDRRMMCQTFAGFEIKANPWACLMNDWMYFHNQERWSRLDNVCYEIGVPVGGHRALGDAKAAREVLRWLARQEA